MQKIHQLNIIKCITKQYHEMTIEYWSLFVSWYAPSWVFSFIVFFIHNSIVSYPNARMDKNFFKSWVLHIPHCLRDLLWMVRAWSSIAPIFSSLIMSQASSSSWSFLKVITSFWHTFLTWMNPTILGGHSRWPSLLLHSSLLLLLLQVVLDLRDPCKVWLCGLWILDLHFLQLIS